MQSGTGAEHSAGPLAVLDHTVLVALSIDGGDEPTDAAGAVAAGNAVACATLIPSIISKRNDAYPLFAALDDLLLPGPTGANVNNLVFLLVGKGGRVGVLIFLNWRTDGPCQHNERPGCQQPVLQLTIITPVVFIALHSSYVTYPMNARRKEITGAQAGLSGQRQIETHYG